MDASPPSWRSQTSVVESLHQRPTRCDIVSGTDPVSWEAGYVTQWNISFFFFFFFFKGCIRATKQTCIPSVFLTCVCVCACACALGALLMKVQPLMAHSAATWTVQSRPKFSICGHKRRTDTVALSFLSATLTQALSQNTHTHTHTHTAGVTAVDGRFWRFSAALGLCLCCRSKKMGRWSRASYPDSLLLLFSSIRFLLSSSLSWSQESWRSDILNSGTDGAGGEKVGGEDWIICRRSPLLSFSTRGRRKAGVCVINLSSFDISLYKSNLEIRSFDSLYFRVYCRVAAGPERM